MQCEEKGHAMRGNAVPFLSGYEAEFQRALCHSKTGSDGPNAGTAQRSDRLSYKGVTAVDIIRRGPT
jgi:hypothetical protein